MALENFEDVSVGVSRSGFEKIKENIKLVLIDEAQEKLKDLEDINTALRDAWSGEDCERFITNLEAAVEEVCEALNNYNLQIEEKLDDVYQAWVNFQNSNVV